MSDVAPKEFEVARFQWGSGDLSEPTDATQITALFQADGGFRLLGYDMGPETKKLYGDFDWTYWIDVCGDETKPFIALLLRLLFEGRETVLTFDQLKSAMEDNEIGYTEGEGPNDDALNSRPSTSA